MLPVLDELIRQAKARRRRTTTEVAISACHSLSGRREETGGRPERLCWESREERTLYATSARGGSPDRRRLSMWRVH